MYTVKNVTVSSKRGYFVPSFISAYTTYVPVFMRGDTH